MQHRIDHLLEDIDNNLVSVLHEIVSTQQGSPELAPLFDHFACEWGMFTLPQIRGLR